MRRLPHVLFVPLTALSLLLLPVNKRLSAADDIESTRVQFLTFDEVELSGTFYRSTPAAGKKDKDAVVLLLHDFRHLKGGSGQEDGWHQLAGQLQKEGYAVLSFDFRGFGNSKSVSPKFWAFAHNRQGISGGSKRNPSATIDEKDFRTNYFINLVNDIAAARAYLNIKNDANEVNASNIILIGAGQGATLGALWLASECRRQKDSQSDRLFPGLLPQFRSLDEPEGNDVAAAVWLTIYPTLEDRRLGSSLIKALVDEAKKARNPIPTLFLYAKNDVKANDFLNKNSDLKALFAENSKKKGGVKEKSVPGAGQLEGSKLLRKSDDIIRDYLNNVVEERGSRTRKDRKDKDFAFCWSLPWPTAPNASRIPAKLPGEPVTRLIPPSALGLSR
jgi:alpha-beta hydrolase superfamily lysophospholipase